MLIRNLIKTADEASYAARADRSIQSGRVLTVNTTDNTLILDVGMVDANGTPVYMVDVPFSPQSPPQSQDIVPILRTNSSPYSHVTGSGAQVGGANSGQVVQNGGVMSVAKSGSAGLKNDVTLTGTGGADLTQSGQNIEIDAGLPTGGTTGQVLAKASGTSYDVAWSSVAGTGDFVGPGAATDHAIVRFDGTTGKLGQDSGITIADGATGALSGTNTGDETAAGILTKLLTVDGSGSGLDADTLDGVSSAGFDAAGAAAAAQAASQPIDADLTTISGLTATSDNFLQSKSSAWSSRTPTQVTADLIAVVGDSGSGGTKGLVPAPGVGDAAAGKFLKADGTFAVPSGSGVPSALLYTNQSIPAGNTLTSTTETAFSSTYTFGAAGIEAGDLIVIRLAGVYSGTVLPTFQGKVKFGSVTLIDTGALTGLVTGTNLPFFAEVRIIVESPGSVPNLPLKANASVQFSTAATAALTVLLSTAPTNVDVSATQAVTVTSQWGAGGTGQTITLEQMTVEQYKI